MGLRGRSSVEEESFFFITTTVVKFQPIFTNSCYCDILLDNIRYYQQKYKFEILAYVIMPSHFHWIIEVDTSTGTVSDIMRDIKKYTAWQIFEKVKLKGQTELERIFREEAGVIVDQRMKLWMRRFDDEVIRNGRMFWNKLMYIHYNPVEAGIVLRAEDYKYSSARNYIHNDHSVIKINTEIGGIYTP